MQVHDQWAALSNCDGHNRSSHDELSKVKSKHGTALTFLLVLDLDLFNNSC